MAKTAAIRNALTQFAQQTGESLCEAWDRYKEMLRKCPHHGMPDWIIINYFYNGLGVTSRPMLDAASRGAFVCEFCVGAHETDQCAISSESAQFQPQYAPRQQLQLQQANEKSELKGLKLMCKSQVVSIKTWENQIGQTANALLNRQPGTLPSDTEVPGKREAKEQRRNRSILHRLFAKRLQKKKPDKQFEKFLEVFKKLHMNIPFAEALEQMPSYAKFMKEQPKFASAIHSNCELNVLNNVSGTTEEMVGAIKTKQSDQERKKLARRGAMEKYGGSTKSSGCGGTPPVLISNTDILEQLYRMGDTLNSFNSRLNTVEFRRTRRGRRFPRHGHALGKAPVVEGDTQGSGENPRITPRRLEYSDDIEPIVELADEDTDGRERPHLGNQVVPHPHRSGRTMEERHRAENTQNQDEEGRDLSALKRRLVIRLEDDDLRMLLVEWQKKRKRQRSEAP
ncbi:hypothetical protein AgCh_037944 [Apium graveolens]